MPTMAENEPEDRLQLLETEIERRLSERFSALREEFDRLRLESDRRWFGFLEKFDQDLRGVVPAELLGGGATVIERKGLVSTEAARVLDLATTQVDVLHKFLDECRRHCSRAALLVARGGSIGAWKAVGFSQTGGDDEAVRQISMPLVEGGLLSRVMTGNALRLPASNEISSLLRAGRVSDAVAIPMVVREKISGALYADVVLGEEGKFDPDALGLLTFLAGLLVDRLASRKLKPAPALRVPEVAKKPEPAGMWMEDAAVPGPAAEATAAEPAPAPSVWSTRPRRRLLRSPARRPRREAGRRVLVHRAGDAAGAAAEAGRRLAGPLAEMSSGDERREEARRFARLLVSEIKLYNERAVLEGREHANLYERLRDDIDRSRQMYEERIPQDVRSSTQLLLRGARADPRRWPTRGPGALIVPRCPSRPPPAPPGEARGLRARPPSRRELRRRRPRNSRGAGGLRRRLRPRRGPARGRQARRSRERPRRDPAQGRAAGLGRARGVSARAGRFAPEGLRRRGAASRSPGLVHRPRGLPAPGARRGARERGQGRRGSRRRAARVRRRRAVRLPRACRDRGRAPSREAARVPGGGAGARARGRRRGDAEPDRRGVHRADPAGARGRRPRCRRAMPRGS